MAKYCSLFGNGQHNYSSIFLYSYNIDIVVTALDSQSAMATYVCLPPFNPEKGCTPDEADASDPRGIAINTVTISTRTGGLKDIYIAVVGWGDGEQTNSFVIGATVTKK